MEKCLKYCEAIIRVYLNDKDLFERQKNIIGIHFGK